MAYDPMQLTVSQHYMAYSAFPPPLDEERRHWLRQEYVDYLGRFRQRFGLDPHIRLNCAVETVSREEEPHVNSNTGTAELSLRDPDGYYATSSALSAA